MTWQDKPCGWSWSAHVGLPSSTADFQAGPRSWAFGLFGWVSKAALPLQGVPGKHHRFRQVQGEGAALAAPISRGPSSTEYMAD